MSARPAPRVTFDRFHTYAEMTELLQAFAEAYPELARLYSIGRSYEGREIWCMEITRRDLGDPERKPGYYIDANIHAGEVTGGATALYTIELLLGRYGQDEEITRLVDELTWYVIPRVSPDGVEKYLTTPYMLRSSVRPYPEPDDPEGLVPEDVDGDGMVLQMRVPDLDGEWKVSERDPRLLVPRRPDETGGRYYRLHTEGVIRGYDGVSVREARPRWGLDLNRNFPIHWEPEAKQRGAGPYPLSEPETRALADFVARRRNIFGAQSYHTYTGIILRPSTYVPDDKLNRHDLALYKAIGKLGEEATGYPCVSIHDGFAYDRHNPIKGVFIDWLYEHLGLVAYSTELWDVRVRAGLPRVAFLQKDRDPEEEGLKLLAWNDRELDGRGFVPWRPFEHPQLGPVEIGGWKVKEVIQNCPLPLLAEEAHKNAVFTVKHAAAAPRVRVERLEARSLGGGLYQLTAVVKNKGYLPTFLTEKALEMKVARPVKARLGLPEGAELIQGRAEEEVGHLGGRVLAEMPFGLQPGRPREKKLEWVLRAPEGSEVVLEVESEKAGADRAAVRLGQG